LKKIIFVFFKNHLKHKIMSVIKGPFDFTGSFGNLRCYDDPGTGKRILSKKGGPSKNQFDSLETMQQARENTNEFGGCSKWASLFKESLSALGHLMHSRCFNNIVSAGKLILRQDLTGDHGFRKVEVKKDLQAITQIDFNERFPFRSVIRDSYAISFLPDKRTATLTISGFVSYSDARWTTKFYAVRLYLVIAQTSDMAWNPVNQKWEPVVSDLEVLSRKTVGEWMFNNVLPVDVNLSVSLDEPAFSSPGTAVVVAMGVEFALTAMNGQPFAMPHTGSMAIVGCYSE
jgi:hypothetical protein